MPNRPPARAHAEAALRAQATRTAIGLIKDRARAYAKRPMTLENIFPGLSAAAPETIIAVAKHLIAAERNAPRRWFGFGGGGPNPQRQGGFAFRACPPPERRTTSPKAGARLLNSIAWPQAKT